MSEIGFDIPDYKKIRVIVDSRYILEDLIAKLQRVCEKKSVKINTTVYTRSPKIK